MLIRRKNFLYRGEFKNILKYFFNGDFINGDGILKFEDTFKKNIAMDYALCTSSGLHALEIILQKLNLEADEEIILPVYTAQVVLKLINKLNLKYKLVDVLHDRATLCPESLRNTITSKTKVVLVTHLLGNGCDQNVFEIIKKNKLIAIEDCAHAYGVSIDNKMAGSIGYASFFSFGYSKPINTFTGGMLVTNDESLYHFAKDKMNECDTPSYTIVIKKILMGYLENFITNKYLALLLYPFLYNDLILKKIVRNLKSLRRGRLINYEKLSNVQALLGLQQLEKFEQINNKRKTVNDLIKTSCENTVSFFRKNVGDNSHYLVAITEDSLKTHKYLLNRRVDTGTSAWVMDNLSENNQFPGMNKLEQTIVRLPNYVDLTRKDMKKISNGLIKCWGSPNE
jgi:dTDP-4-amino-4,6-dideoxygalactose transaminase